MNFHKTVFDLAWSNVWRVEWLRDRIESWLNPGEAWQHDTGAHLRVTHIHHLQLIIRPGNIVMMILLLWQSYNCLRCEDNRVVSSWIILCYTPLLTWCHCQCCLCCCWTVSWVWRGTGARSWSSCWGPPTDSSCPRCSLPCSPHCDQHCPDLCSAPRDPWTESLTDCYHSPDHLRTVLEAAPSCSLLVEQPASSWVLDWSEVVTVAILDQWSVSWTLLECWLEWCAGSWGWTLLRMMTRGHWTWTWTWCCPSRCWSVAGECWVQSSWSQMNQILAEIHNNSQSAEFVSEMIDAPEIINFHYQLINFLFQF